MILFRAARPRRSRGSALRSAPASGAAIARQSGKVGALVAVALALHGCAGSASDVPPAQRPTMIDIPAGTFGMGDFAEGDDADATPVHEVAVAPFRLARTETTLGQYRAYLRQTKSAVPDALLDGSDAEAVAGVTWEEAVAFCATLGYRLPTEQEWEYAARSGGRAEIFAGSDTADEPDRFLRYAGNVVGSLTPVARRESNGLGLFDMSGNVFEWVGAYYEFYPDSGAVPMYNDFTVSDMRIIRGGSFRSELRESRTFHRSAALHDERSEMIGFRCAADPG